MPPRAAAKTRRLGDVEKAVRVWLDDLKKLDPRLAVSPEAASALSLARTIDDSAISATSRGINAKELRETMACLRALAPEARALSPLDEIRARRDRKLAGSAAAQS